MHIFARVFLFVCILFIMVSNLGIIMRSKLLTGESPTPITTWVDEFYALPRNSVDIIYLGTSASFCSVNPVQIFNETGISSYSLCTSRQNIHASRAYLEEALKTQTPKLVLLNVNNFYFDRAEESWNRYTYDSLKFSYNKFSNLSESMNPEESIISYVFPILRFHDRWKELKCSDFQYWNHSYVSKTRTYMGYSPRWSINEIDTTYFFNGAATSAQEISTTVKTAVASIYELCAANNIQLIFWKAPEADQHREYNVAVSDLAAILGVEYWDLSTLEGIDIHTDFLDDRHLNDNGSQKISHELSKRFRYMDIEWSLPDQEISDNYSQSYLLYLEDRHTNAKTLDTNTN